MSMSYRLPLVGSARNVALLLVGGLLLGLGACNGTEDTGEKEDSAATCDMVLYYDADGDNWGDETQFITGACAPELQWVSMAGDCALDDPNIYPFADELCDDIDQDCDSEIDEDPIDGNAFFVDPDGDGYGIMGDAFVTCGRVAPEGYASEYGDCDETDPDINPGETEKCATDYDDNCNGKTEEEGAVGSTDYYLDFDGDGYGNPESIVSACVPVKGGLTQGGDCDDTRVSVYPDAPELCDTLDNDCDTDIDEDPVEGYPQYVDADLDGFGDSLGVPVMACVEGKGFSVNNLDCDDTDATISPSATETCGDLIDQNCDEVVDEGC